MLELEREAFLEHSLHAYVPPAFSIGFPKNKRTLTVKAAMGQYYKAVLLLQTQDAQGQVVYTIIGWLSPYGCGECAKLLEHAWVKNPFVINLTSLLCPEGKFPQGARVVWAGDYADPEPAPIDDNLYSHCEEMEETDVLPGICMTPFPFVLNHDSKQYARVGPEGTLHPLPILTCEGNGRGGGDLPLSHSWFPLAGTWARALISMAAAPPDDSWTELVLPESDY